MTRPRPRPDLDAPRVEPNGEDPEARRPPPGVKQQPPAVQSDLAVGQAVAIPRVGEDEVARPADADVIAALKEQPHTPSAAPMGRTQSPAVADDRDVCRDTVQWNMHRTGRDHGCSVIDANSRRLRLD